MSAYRIYAHNKKISAWPIVAKNMALPESILAEKYDFVSDVAESTFFRKGALSLDSNSLQKVTSNALVDS